MTFAYKSSAVTLAERPTERPATASFGRRAGPGAPRRAGRASIRLLPRNWGLQPQIPRLQPPIRRLLPCFERQLPPEREKIVAGNRADVHEHRAAIVGRLSKGRGFQRLLTHKEKCYTENAFGEILRQES